MNSKEKEKIQKWIDNPKRTATQGLNLYVEFGRKPNLLRRLRRQTDDKRVIDTLLVQFKLMLGLPILPQSKEEKPKDDTKTAGKDLPQFDINQIKDLDKTSERELADPFPEEKRPKELIDIYTKKNTLYVEAKNLFSMLVAKGDEMEKFDEESEDYQAIAAERKEMAKQIISKYDQVNECWKQIDYFAKHGKLPEVEDLKKKPEIKADDEDPIALDKRWRTLGTYISKAKKKPEKNAEKLAELYAESNVIADKLNKMAGEEKYKMREYETPAKEESTETKDK